MLAQAAIAGVGTTRALTIENSGYVRFGAQISFRMLYFFLSDPSPSRWYGLLFIEISSVTLAAAAGS